MSPNTRNRKPRRKLYILLTLTLLLLTAGALSWYLFMEKSDEVQIRNVIDKLAENFSKPEKANPALTLLDNKAIAESFVYPLEINIEGFGNHSFDSPETLTSMLTRYRALLKNAQLEFNNVTITVEQDRAVAAMSAMLTGSAKNGGRFMDGYDVTMTLNKNSGEWKISRIKAEKVLKQSK